MRKRLFSKLSLFLIPALGLMITPLVQAQYTPPTFPSCPGPVGTTLASYPSGIFAIVGNPVLQPGSDSVYQEANGNVMQCFCPPQGSVGIQTNWLPADNIAQADINNLISQGWHLIPNGAGWGLQNIPYLALNLNSSCGPGTSPTPTPTQISSSQPTPSGNTLGISNNPPNNPSAPVCSASMPSTPTLQTVERTSPTSAVVSWFPVDNVSDYAISYGLTSHNYSFGVPSTGNVHSLTISNLDPNSSYCFAVRALNSCQPSNLSNEICTSSGGSVLGISAVIPQGEVLGASIMAPTSNGNLGLIAKFLMVFGLMTSLYGFTIKKLITVR